MTDLDLRCFSPPSVSVRRCWGLVELTHHVCDRTCALCILQRSVGSSSTSRGDSGLGASLSPSWEDPAELLQARGSARSCCRARPCLWPAPAAALLPQEPGLECEDSSVHPPLLP